METALWHHGFNMETPRSSWLYNALLGVFMAHWAPGLFRGVDSLKARSLLAAMAPAPGYVIGSWMVGVWRSKINHIWDLKSAGTQIPMGTFMRIL